jgi:hypothetical protein
VIIKNGEWFWPHACSDALVEVQSRLLEVEIVDADLPVWNSSSGQYSYAETSEKLREVHLVVNWWKLVWFPISIPCHSFMLWLVFRDALVTKKRMCGWGYAREVLCPFCYGCIESHEHLFFKCSFSRQIWTKIMAKCSILNAPLEWENIEERGLHVLLGKGIRACMGRLCFGATVYNLCKQRNDLLHKNTPHAEEAILDCIRWEVRKRILAKGCLKNINQNLSIVQRWKL